MSRRIRTLVAVAAVAVVAGLAAPAAAGPATAAPIGGGAQTSNIFYTGTLQPGATQTSPWNYVPAGLVLQVSLSPLGASTTTPCQMEVTRQWYVQNSNGSRSFWWTVKNVGALACGANVLLTGHSAVGSFNQSALNPGQTWNTYWTIDSTDVWSLGLAPTGATSTKACSMELTRTWVRTDNTKRQLWMTIKNTGTIACSTTVLVTHTPEDVILSLDMINPGQTHDFSAYNVSPTVGYWTMPKPPLLVTCSLEVTREFWVQRITSSGPKREFYYSVKNIGSPLEDGCTGSLMVDKVEA